MSVDVNKRPHVAGGLAPREDNLPSRLLERFDSLQSDGDWSAVEDLLAPDMVCNDHRDKSVFTSRAALVAATAKCGEDDLRVAPPRLLAMRGQRLALLHVDGTESNAQAGPTDMLVAVECNEQGLVVRLDLYDTADFVAAVRGLVLRYLDELPPELVKVLGPSAALMTAVTNRDLVGARSVLSDSFRLVDHVGGLGRGLNLDQFIDVLGSVLADDTDLVDFTTDIHAINTGGLVSSRTQVSLDTVDAIDNEITLVAVKNGLVESLHFYDGSELHLALERLALLDR